MQYRYISGDSHLEIDSKHWIGRVPAKYRDQAPRLVRQADGSDMWMIGDKINRAAAAADLYGGKGRDAYVPFEAATKAHLAPAARNSASASRSATASMPSYCSHRSRAALSFGAASKTTMLTKRWCAPTIAGSPKNTAQ